MKNHFRTFAVFCAHWMGSSYAFAVGVLVIILWAITGPYFKFSDTWQLVINTGTTVVTFLMVFIIQYTQNRDTQAMQMKLDELVRAVKDARNEVIGVEDKTDDQLNSMKKNLSNRSSEHPDPAIARTEGRRGCVKNGLHELPFLPSHRCAISVLGGRALQMQWLRRWYAACNPHYEHTSKSEWWATLHNLRKTKHARLDYRR